MLYQTSMWSIDSPDDWEVDQDEFSTSFFSPEGGGILQIHASAREHGMFGEEELRSAAASRIDEGMQLTAAVAGDFSGLTTSFARERNQWREWWLRSGRVMLYIAHMQSKADTTSNEDTLAAVLATLRVGDEYAG